MLITTSSHDHLTNSEKNVSAAVRQRGEYEPEESDDPYRSFELELAVANKCKQMRTGVDNYRDLPEKAWLLWDNEELTMENCYSLEYLQDTLSERSSNFLTYEEILNEQMETQDDNLEIALSMLEVMGSALKYDIKEKTWMVKSSK